MSNSPPKRSSMARVNEGSHSFTYHPHVYLQVAYEPYLLFAAVTVPKYIALAAQTQFLQRAQCSHCKRCISYGNSVCPSVTRRYCVKTTARSTVQFAPLDSKMCLVL